MDNLFDKVEVEESLDFARHEDEADFQRELSRLLELEYDPFDD